MEGWVKIHRKIIDNPYYFSEPFTRSQAWVDMIIIANHKPGMFYKRGIRVDVKRGEIGYDIETLAKRWKWSRGKAERFFLQLENDSQIVRQKTNVTTILSILNYELYQGDDNPNQLPNDKANDKANGQQTVKQTETNNNDNNKENDKNDKKKRSSVFAPPIFEDVKTFFVQKGYSESYAIEFFEYYTVANWFDARGNKVKNWKQKAISVWLKEDKKTRTTQPLGAR